MIDYRVSWEIDVSADSPRSAAEQAWGLMRAPGSTANVFKVQQIGQEAPDHVDRDGVMALPDPVEIDLSTGPDEDDEAEFRAMVAATLDDEPDEPERPEEPQAWQTYDCHTAAFGRIQCYVRTNDDEDKGYPTRNAEWNMEYQNKEAFLKAVSGGSHVGMVGVKVTVHLDGMEVKDGVSAGS